MEENKQKLNPWVISTTVLSIICLILIVNTFYKETPEVLSLEQELCSSISGTPAWGDSNGNILFNGYSNFSDADPSEVVDNLVKDKIHFLYNPNCGWCKKQIEYFGNDWERYFNSGLVVDCQKINS